MSDPALEREALALFEQMLELPEADRDAWLAGMVQDRPELLSRIAALRSSDGDPPLRTGGAFSEVAEVPPPERIGAYRITELIGTGGMGSVYRGERDVGDFTHRVAIKLIKPGLLSERLVDRFVAERQTLAHLSHPNIAQLYDGGAIDGSPYIVMELIDGLPLLDWADREKLTPEGRCRLFNDICDAVMFAHRNLIVHRDLTPSNILVTKDGTAKLIDFGIARPTAEGAIFAPASKGASIGSLSLTPGYAAPERQISSAVTTAADIFSLGKIFEQLIDPALPDPELRAIIDRATARMPDDRYPTAQALSDDVMAWTEGRPVAAINGGRSYVLGKFIARNRTAVVASACGLVLLLAAFGVTGWSLIRSEQLRTAEAERFDQVRTLANAMLGELDGRMRSVPGNTAARGALAGEADRYLRLLAASQSAPDALRIETARGLIQLAEIQGLPIGPNLGETAKAEANLALADTILAPLAPGNPALNTDRALVAAYDSLVQLQGRAKSADATKRLAQAEALLVSVPAPLRDQRWHETRRSIRLGALEIAYAQDDLTGIPAVTAAMRADRANWPAAMRTNAVIARDEAWMRYFEALAVSVDDLEGSVDRHIDVERRYDAMLAATPNDPLLLFRSVYNAYDGFAAASQLGREDVSARMIGKAREEVDRLSTIDDRDDSIEALRVNIREGYAQNLRDLDQFDAAIAMEQSVVAGRVAAVRASGNSKILGNVGFSQTILGIIARDAGNRALACDSWRDAEVSLKAAKQAGTIIGFHESFLPGLAAHLAACKAGKSIDAPMRGG